MARGFGETERKPIEQPDRQSCAHFSIVFAYLGMCTMLPWNFLISITAFWNYKFRAVENITYDLVTNSSTATTTVSGFDDVSNPIPITPLPPPGPLPIIKPTEMQLSFPSYVAIASNIPGAITTLLHSGFGQRVRLTNNEIGS